MDRGGIIDYGMGLYNSENSKKFSGNFPTDSEFRWKLPLSYSIPFPRKYFQIRFRFRKKIRPTDSVFENRSGIRKVSVAVSSYPVLTKVRQLEVAGATGEAPGACNIAAMSSMGRGSSNVLPSDVGGWHVGPSAMGPTCHHLIIRGQYVRGSRSSSIHVQLLSLPSLRSSHPTIDRLISKPNKCRSKFTPRFRIRRDVQPVSII